VVKLTFFAAGAETMARRTPKPEAQFMTTLMPLRQTCEGCGKRLWVAYHCRRKVMTLQGVFQLRVVIYQCHNSICSQYHVRYHPEEEGSFALPHGEFGLDVIALIGAWRFREHRSVPQMHQRLQARGLAISEREVTHLMQRYEELVSLRLTDRERIKTRLQKQGQVILALDGLQPDVGHEVLWVVRDCLSEEILLARPLLSSTQGDITALLQEVKQLLEPLKIPIKGLLSDGEETIKSAVAFVFPNIPHQLCQFHYLKDAIKPFYEADRHAKTLLKKQLRGVRPIERALEEHPTPENDAIRDYCLAVRASLTDDGRSPLEASGLRLHDRITQISDSIGRVQGKKDCPQL
jgi:MULE transposase domain